MKEMLPEFHHTNVLLKLRIKYYIVISSLSFND